MANLSRHTPTRLAAACLAALFLCSLWAPSASAQVHVDPGGPAGKQYSDSLNEARAQNSDTDPATAVPGSGAGEPPLFGEGVSSPSSSGQEVGNESQSGSAGGGVPAVGESSSDGSGSTGTLLVLIAGVVALGSLAGVGIARLSRRQPA